MKGRPKNVSDLFSIKVENLYPGIRLEELNELFCKFGEIADLYIPRIQPELDKENKKPRRGFVR